ncbi:MAG: bifunctional UDP-N-acetylmuramoyl-tripeptide:D-alanyl-D-alanine ligase/alanine racemase [bacterium]
MYTLSEIADAVKGKLYLSGRNDPEIEDLLIDSRRLISPEKCLFIAIVSDRNDGHKYIGELYGKGVRAFLVSQWPVSPEHDYLKEFPEASFVFAENSLSALQELAGWHRRHFRIPVIAVTGSNGKTIVKEWLSQLLCPELKIIRSPKSYNSQIGVPLSVWKLNPESELGIFEAGISRPGEMERLEEIIRPDTGIFTNIGHAHDEYFFDQKEKVREKLRLFKNASLLIYCADYHLISSCLEESSDYQNLKTFTWSRHQEADLRITQIEKTAGQTLITAHFHSQTLSVTIPFTDEASVENAIHCWALLLNAGGHLKTSKCKNTKPLLIDQQVIATRMKSLAPVAMRLELKEAINNCSLINDSYNSDINSLGIALDFLSQQNQHKKRTIILSDILQSGRDKEELYKEIASQLSFKKVDRIIGIGRDISKFADKFPMTGNFFPDTDEFLTHFPLSSFQDETILLKGARLFEFERISHVLQQKAHETVMEINMDALVHNLNYFRSMLKPGVKTMAMVKAFSYGSGSFEIANVLQFNHVDYLAVAYADEGVELRKAGIHLPVMVMSPEEQSLDTLLKFNLEPEIYNMRILKLLDDAIERNHSSNQEKVCIHIKLDTGMHRLGFAEEEIDALMDFLEGNQKVHIQSVFSHLAASEDTAEDAFTQDQIDKFTKMSNYITQKFSYPVLLHILNSAGTARFPQAQFGMVRLGIGLYGIASSPREKSLMRNVITMKTVITQIKRIRTGETIGYNRMGKADKDMVIAIVPVGYADGLNRKLGNGKGKLFIHGKPSPIIGNVCMDLTMLDLGDAVNLPGTPEENQLQVQEGDEVIIFGDEHPVEDLARDMGTIPYEVLTTISRRVKRVYFHE